MVSLVFLGQSLLLVESQNLLVIGVGGEVLLEEGAQRGGSVKIRGQGGEVEGIILNVEGLVVGVQEGESLQGDGYSGG